MNARGQKQRNAPAHVAAAWLDFVNSEAAQNQDKKAHELQVFPAKSFAEWLPASYLAIEESDREIAAGACIMLSENMKKQAQRVVQAHREAQSPLCLLGDFTFKIGCEGWGLATLALTNKHTCETTGVPVSEAVPIAYGWAPKECAASWGGVLLTMVDVYLSCFELHKRLRAVILDGTPGGLQACKRIFPLLPVLNDTRHVQVNMRKVKRETCPSAALATYLSGEIHFSAALSSNFLFHRYWQAVLNDLLLADQNTVAEYIRKQVLTWDDQDWVARRSKLFVLFLSFSCGWSSCGSSSSSFLLLSFCLRRGAANKSANHAINH